MIFSANAERCTKRELELAVVISNLKGSADPNFSGNGRLCFYSSNRTSNRTFHLGQRRAYFRFAKY